MTVPATIARSRNGFTLMEVVLALGASAMVLIAVNTVFYSALRLRNLTTLSLESSRPVERALAILKADLLGIIPPGGTLSGELQTSARSENENATEFAGVRVSPELHTCSAPVDDSTPYSEVQKVAYYLTTQDSPESGRGLVRVVSRNLLPATTEQPISQWLMDGIGAMAFDFFDGNDWTDVWDSTTSSNLPVAIRVRIALAENPAPRMAPAPIELVVPLVVEGLTNRTEQTTGGTP